MKDSEEYPIIRNSYISDQHFASAFPSIPYEEASEELRQAAYLVACGSDPWSEEMGDCLYCDGSSTRGHDDNCDYDKFDRLFEKELEQRGSQS